MKLEDIKANDYLYYTERPYSDYADSLIHVRDVDGVLMAHPVCTNFRGKYINETTENWGEDVPVADYFDETCWFPTHYMGGDPAAWMTENIPLANVENHDFSRLRENIMHFLVGSYSIYPLSRKPIGSRYNISNRSWTKSLTLSDSAIGSVK